jgi:aryl-phospho-beta-D-glucosidase BglC (GH1 family)
MAYAATYAPATARYPDTFHVEGTMLVDSAGQETVFRGLVPLDPVYQYYASLPDSPYYEPYYIPWGREHFEKMAAWGATIVSLSIHPVTWRTHGKEQCLAILDQAIEWAADYGMYVYIDYHSIGFPPSGEYESMVNHLYGEIYVTTEEETRAFWRDISSYYAGNNVVALYHLFNEPVYEGFTGDDPKYIATTSDWLQWKAFAEELIDIVRTNDPDAVIMVSGLNWAYDLSFVVDYPVERGNIVYSTHPYPDSNGYRSWDEAFGVVRDRYPVFATEFGFSIGGEKDEETYFGPGRYRDAIKYYLEKEKISWTAWCFSYIWTPALLEDRSYTPTEPGIFFRSWLLEYAGGDPSLAVWVNGSTGSVTVGRGTPVAIAVRVSAGDDVGGRVECWLYAETPFGRFSYRLGRSGNGWRRGMLPVYAGPLRSLSLRRVFYGTRLPVGEYTVHFAIDDTPDGLLSPDPYTATAALTVQ